MTTWTQLRSALPAPWSEMALGLPDDVETCELYDERGAAVYDDLARADTSEIATVVAALRGCPGPVLELAAGSGRMTIALLRSGCRVTAVDLSPTLLALLRGRLQQLHHGVRARCTVIEADVRDLPDEHPPGAAHAAVIMNAGSIALFDPGERDALVTHAARLLPPGGRLLLSCRRVGVEELEHVEARGASGLRHRILRRRDTGRRGQHVLVVREAGDRPPLACLSWVHDVTVEDVAGDMRRAGLTLRLLTPLEDGLVLLEGVRP